jgi:hypothetical protein
MDARKKRRLIGVYFFTVLFIVVFFAIPLPYYSVSPGTAIPLSDEPGHFFVVSSNVAMNRYAVWLGLTDNAFRTSPFIALLSLTSPNADLVPFPENYTFTSEQVKAYHDAEQEAGQVVARFCRVRLSREKPLSKYFFGGEWLLRKLHPRTRTHPALRRD